MRFKKLELLGFKSFAEPTELTFEPGVTAVVGPNGCGKCTPGWVRVALADGSLRAIGSLVEDSLSASSQIHPIDDGVYTLQNPHRVFVLSLNPATLRLEKRPVTAFVRRTAPETLVRVRTRSGREITATAYHPLFILKEGGLQPVAAEELRPGIRIAVPRTLPVFSSLIRSLLADEFVQTLAGVDDLFLPYTPTLEGLVRTAVEKHGSVSEAAKNTGVSSHCLKGLLDGQSLRIRDYRKLLQGSGLATEDYQPQEIKAFGGSHPTWIPRLMGEPLARFLGYLISEGYITSTFLVFTNSDQKLIQDFCAVTGSVFGLKPNCYAHPQSKHTTIAVTPSLPLIRLLEILFGMKAFERSAQKRVPPQVFEASNEIVAAFLSALFEGDAYLSDRKRMRFVEYSTASEQLAKDVSTLLLRLGVIPTVRKKRKCATNTERKTIRTYYSVYIYGWENLQQLASRLAFHGNKKQTLERFKRLSGDSNPNYDLIPGASRLIHQVVRQGRVPIKPNRGRFPRFAAYCEERCEASREGVEEALQLIGEQARAEIPAVLVERLKHLGSSDVLWDEVVEVKEVPSPDSWVYDLCVAETHNFVAENIVVHNSNIADAIKWVLGEQSARELRGGKMEDLIFNGSDRRDPIHFAEVSLTLDNFEKKLPVEYSEVRIARRLYRSGESEYLLNGSAVRLKDVTELLMGTGIGTSAYSLFEQGRIEQIISARPEERRVVFEEAAGITKYKSQKREAMRRLEETEDNLARVSDVVAEVRRQIQALERQVRRAKLYQEQMEELKNLELQSARRELGKLKGLSREKEELLQGCRVRTEELEQQTRGWESRVAEARAQVSRMEEALSRTREQLLAMIHRQETARGNLERNRERIAEGQTRSAALRQEIASAEAQAAQLEIRHGELSEAIARQEQERRQKEEKISQGQTRLQDCARVVEEAQRSIVQARERLLEVTGSQVQAKNGLGRVRQEAARLEARAGRLQMEATKVTGEQNDAETLARSMEENLLQARTVFEGLEQEQRLCQENLSATEAGLTAAQQEVSGLEQEMARVGSQLELLQGLLASHEGYSSGVKVLLTALDSGALARDGVIGVLAELIQVERPDMAAVDAALGPWAESVVVESAEVAARCRRFLEENRAGRVLFLLLDRVPETAPAAVASPAGAIPLIDRIGITPHLNPLLQLLLTDSWLVPSREAAQALGSAGTRTGQRFVTLEGELWSLASALLGSAPSEEGLIVGRMSRLQSLEVAASHCEGRLAEAKNRLRSLQDQRESQAQALEVLDGTMQERSEEIHRLEADRSNAQTTLEKLRQEQQVLRTEESEVGEELKTIRLELDRWEKELAIWEQELESLQEGIHQAQETLAQTGRLREEISVELATAKSERASFEEVAASRRASLQLLVQSMETVRAQANSRREELTRQEQRQVEWEAACAEMETGLGRMSAEQTQAQAQVDQAERVRAEALNAAQVEEKQFGVIRRQLDELQTQLHGQEMERAQVVFQREQIVSRLKQVYQLELTGGEELPAEQTEEQIESARVRMEELSQKLQRMGPVNLGSIDEERELQNRWEYLTTQQNDLVKAKEDLHEAILKINRTTRAMFRETFQAIHKEFQITYRQLFGGGEARLVLMDEEDVLESGIEIIARPPGKALQPISLLSGGEKALTTIALLFAIFRIKPSPFCLLDEIDAPLDELNIDRFTRALREFLRDSQFIIITHNKKTMSMADVMYGITMQEMGVSKIVSVKFKDAPSPGMQALQPAP